MRSTILPLFFCLVTIAVVPSCTWHNLEEIQSVGPCFEQDVLPIMVSNCAQDGCHNSRDREQGYDFSSYEGILKGIRKGRSADSDIIEAMLDEDDDDRMPPAPLDRLSPDKIAQIAAWIDAGAFMDTGCEAESCDSLSNVSYTADVKPIMDLHCRGCHNINNPSGGFEFEDYQQASGAASSGALTGVLTGDAAYVQMPWNASPLSPCKVEKILVWVQEGAQDN